jgi:hypothetical protein
MVEIYVDVVGLKTSSDAPDQKVLDLKSDSTGCSTLLRLIATNQPINHGGAFGRLAIGVQSRDMQAFDSILDAHKVTVHTPRVSLDTPGKATVEVIIIQDRDGYEVCLVGMAAFLTLAEPVAGGDLVDWAYRLSSGSHDAK